MSTTLEQGRSSLAEPRQTAQAPIESQTGFRIEGGPRGAYVVAGLAVGLLFVAWLAFYFLLFMPRGSVG